MQIVLDIRWLVLIILILLSGFFSASETALMSLNRIQIRQLAKRKKNKKGAESLLRIKGDTHKLLSTILIGNNLVNIGASALVTSIAIETFGSMGVGIATGVMTFIILMFGEIGPKSLAVRKSKEISVMVAPVFEFLSYILSPVIWFLDHINNVLMFLFKAAGEEEDILTEEEITSIVSIGAEEGAIKEQEREMIYKIFKFDDIPVSDIMVPKLEVKMLDADTKLSSLLRGKKLDQLKGYSRFPVYDENEDNIIGIFYFKTALKEFGKRRNKKVRDFVMPTLFVPETMKIDTLFSEFQNKKVHMALVVNEHGALEGLVTLEDILEEIVGEIEDETDVSSESVKEINPNTYLVNGSMRLDDINEELGINLSDEEADTVGGYISKKLEKIPKMGEKVTEGKVVLKVENASKRRIKTVQITLKKR